LAEKEKRIIIDRHDWEGMQTAVVAELKSSHIAVKVLTCQLRYIDEQIARLPKDEKAVKPVAGVG